MVNGLPRKLGVDIEVRSQATHLEPFKFVCRDDCVEICCLSAPVEWFLSKVCAGPQYASAC